MSVKRSRVGSSSNQLATPVSATPAKVMKADSAAQEAFDLHFSGEESDPLKIGGFLELCHYCSKRISQNSEVFMYSNLCAFCSAECRDHQIALDKSTELFNVKGHSGS